MLPIPSSLLDKVKQAMQTIGNNAEPKMTIIAQKAAKYLNQGSFLTPRTVRTGNSLGPLDICIRRETPHQEPTEIVMAYIEDGAAKVATLPYVHTPDQYFEYQYTVGPATDVACDFDGRWNLITDRSDLYFDTETVWELITFGEPYIITVNGGVLSVRQGQGGSSTLSTNTDKCSIIRGWKARFSTVTNDQGMLCAYTKLDGKVYYRNYCEQSDTSFIWEPEQEITEITALGLVSSISLFRASDYRIGFLFDISGTIHLLMTERNWSGMALLPENVTLTTLVAQGQSIPIIYISNSNYENITLLDTYAESWPMSIFSPILMAVENIPILMIDEQIVEYYDWGYIVKFYFDQCIRNANVYPSDFILEDDSSNLWYGQESWMDSPHSNIVYVRFLNFNNAINNIVAKVVSGNLTNGYTLLENTNVIFSATNLVPIEVDPPVLLNVWNENNQTFIFEFDKPIVEIASQSGMNISGYEPSYSPEGVLNLTNYVVDFIKRSTFDSIDIVDLSLATHVNTINYGDLLILKGLFLNNNFTKGTGSGTSTTIILPTVVTGDLLLVAISKDGTGTTTGPSGWTKLGEQAYSGNLLAIYYKISDGTETEIIISHATEATTYIALAFHGVDVPIVSSSAVGNNTTPNSPNLISNFDDGALTLWLSIAGWDYSRTLVSYPTNYTEYLITQNTTYDGAGIALAAKINTLPNEDPGAFTIDGTDTWVAYTLAIKSLFTRAYSGYAILNPVSLNGLANDICITYNMDKPAGTSILIEYAISNSSIVQPSSWEETSLESVISIPNEDNYYIWIRITLETEDLVLTPSIWNLKIIDYDSKKIQVNLTYANRMKHPQGNVLINFVGSILGAFNSQVAPFDVEILPENLDLWFNPSASERVVISELIANGESKLIGYINLLQPNERVEFVNLVASGISTHIDDLET